MVQSYAGLEAWFISSLAEAGSCHKHSRKQLQPSTFFTARRPIVSAKKPQTYNVTFERHKHTKELECPDEEVPNAKELPPEANTTKQELLDLVDQYDGLLYTDQLPLLELPQLYQPSDGPFLEVSDKPQDEWPPPHYTWPADTETQFKLDVLKSALDDFSRDPREIYQFYRALPNPRAPYLPSKTRHKLLRHLAVVEKKDEHSMLRYLSVVDDMKGAAIPLAVSEWTSALSFVSRYVSNVTEAEVEAALHMWREMEHTAGVKGNSATFNVLFDVACKAGKFVLAEMIYKEMEARGFQFDRFHHVSKIFYYSQKRNGDGARAAYRALVEAGEIVDTVVLNAMIAALVRSYEPSAAENIYERMKTMHFDRQDAVLPPRDYKTRRTIDLSLKKIGRESKDDLAAREKFQTKSIIAPDLHTFNILIKYYAEQAGEIDKTAKLLDEMKWFELPLHGTLFLSLFKGFAAHGGVRYSGWTEARLNSVFKSLLNALDEGSEGLYLSQWLVTWTLKAFAKCAGRDKTMAAWEELRGRWEPDEAELDFVLSGLRHLMEKVPDAKVVRSENWHL